MRNLLKLLSIVLLLSASTYASEWKTVKSKNFHLIGNASEKSMGQLAIKLEQFRSALGTFFKKETISPSIPLTIIIFKNQDTYLPYKPVREGHIANVAGYFLGSDDVNYITMATNGMGNDPLDVIYHEFVHLVAHNSMPVIPAWFNEGLAEFFSSFELTQGGKKAFIGKAHKHHLRILQSRFIPLETFFEVQHTFQLGDNPERAATFYAQSWALVHYLRYGLGGKREPMIQDFLTRMSRGAPVKESFQRSFQVDLSSFEKEFKNFLAEENYEFKTIDLEAFADSQLQTSLLTFDQAHTVLGDLLYRSGRYPHASVLLQQAVDSDPKLALAHSSLGLVKLAQNKRAEAVRLAENGVKADPNNYLSQYYYAKIASDGIENGRIAKEEIEKICKSLRRSIELNPSFPQSYHLLAYINIVTEQNIDESITLLNRAKKLYPGRLFYDFTLAQAYLRKQNITEARELLYPILEYSDDDLKNSARDLMSEIDRFQEALRDNKLNNTTLAKHESDIFADESSSAEVVEEEVSPEVANRNARIKALREALRPPQAGEKQFTGVLTSVECVDKKNLSVTVKKGTQSLRFATKNVEMVEVVSFSTDVPGKLSCGPRTKPETILLTYKPGNSQGLEGDLVSIEFLPSDLDISLK